MSGCVYGYDHVVAWDDRLSVHMQAIFNKTHLVLLFFHKWFIMLITTSWDPYVHIFGNGCDYLG